MQELHRELIQALRRRLLAIANRELAERDPNAHLAELKSASEAISALARCLPRSDDPQLAHYLDRCSYEKALTLLEALPDELRP